MDMIEAIERRISCRAFQDRPLEASVFAQLEAEVERINNGSELNFQLYGPRENGTAIDMALNMFASNPPCYAALVGPVGPEPEEKLGYYGEQLALFATKLGLGTCWVASTYKAQSARAQVPEGQRLHDVMPIGYAPEKMPLTQRTLRAGLRKRDKSLDELWQGPGPFDQAPEWIQAGIIAAQMGPSAVNAQGYVFTQEAQGAPVRAVVPTVKRGLEYTDLGIAKLHFQLAAEACGLQGYWEWGSGGAFILA